MNFTGYLVYGKGNPFTFKMTPTVHDEIKQLLVVAKIIITDLRLELSIEKDVLTLYKKS